LPLSLIRRMDELINQGVGGYQTRAELIREAVEALVLELSYERAPDEPVAWIAPLSDRQDARTSSIDTALRSYGPGDTIDLEATGLRMPPSTPTTISDGHGEVIDEPLF